MDRALAVDGLSQGIHNTSGHGIAHRNLHHASRGLYCVALADAGSIAQENRTHVVLLQVQHHAIDLSRELQELSLHGVFKTMDPCDAVCHLNDRSHVRNFQFCRISFDLLFDDRADLFWS